MIPATAISAFCSDPLDAPRNSQGNSVRILPRGNCSRTNPRYNATMVSRKIHMVLPVLLLASAAQPTYRLGAFIEAVNVKRLTAPSVKPDESQGRHQGDRSHDDSPEPSWPVELVPLFPASTGSGEHVLRAPLGAKRPVVAAVGFLPLWSYVTRTSGPPAALSRAEPSAAASVAVVAHPIHTHAPPRTA